MSGAVNAAPLPVALRGLAMLSPTPAEALALLKETVAVSQWLKARTHGTRLDEPKPNGPDALDADPLLRQLGAPTLAGLVAELYGALGEHACAGTIALDSDDIEGCGACDTLRACEGALVAWAEKVAARDKEEPQHLGT